MAGWMDGWMDGCIDCLLAVLVTMMMLMIVLLPPEQPLPTSKDQRGVGAPVRCKHQKKKVESSDPSQKIGQPFVQRPKVVAKYRVQCNVD